jgi:hypothetical protein
MGGDGLLYQATEGQIPSLLTNGAICHERRDRSR